MVHSAYVNGERRCLREHLFIPGVSPTKKKATGIESHAGDLVVEVLRCEAT